MKRLLVLAAFLFFSNSAYAEKDYLRALDYISSLEDNIVSSGQVNFAQPFFALGGAIGIKSDNELFEAGVDAFYFDLLAEDNALGVALGGYLQVAPIPGSVGRRFYIKGSLYKMIASGDPSLDGSGIGFALGYRHRIYKDKIIFAEAGLDLQELEDYGEEVIVLRLLKVGLGFD